jgi:hypothetical protein
MAGTVSLSQLQSFIERDLAPEHGKITTVWLSDRCGGQAIPQAMPFIWEVSGLE